MRITWHNYSYYPYERVLASKEVATLLGTRGLREVDDGIEVSGVRDCRAVERLAYFSGAVNGGGFEPTVQAKLEQAARRGKNKQATRYSAHGLHEYKGKFNPQVVRALLNIFGVQPGQRVVDPFCGSGTTLVECAHLGAHGVGADINPLAVMIARAKLQALCTPVTRLRMTHKRLAQRLKRAKPATCRTGDDPRARYLSSWFDSDVLGQIEQVRLAVSRTADDLAPILLVIASNLLRDYSQQDPNDLRTRRRKSPLPSTPFTEAFLDAVPPLLQHIESAQSVLGTDLPHGKVRLGDVTRRMTAAEWGGGLFDAAVTSPPYAMALPYIDTQRLSLVWLELCQPSDVLKLESDLVGSREVRGRARHDLQCQLEANADGLPSAQARLCLDLHRGLSEDDGFRRQAVPKLLYRYFAAMKASFRTIKAAMKPGAPFALIVGHNRTTIGGILHEIDTPVHLTCLAMSEGWGVDERIPLQTYRRYGYHMSNAVAAETLIVLRNPA